ncbi:hypothetical protein QOT17_018863 [Balamuthia mandrillaris]
MSNAATTWIDLPNEIWVEVFSYCRPGTLARCSLVNNYWKQLASENSLWKALCFAHFHLEEDDLVREEPGFSWRWHYRCLLLKPKWDKERSEPDVWTYSYDDSQIRRDGSKGWSPKAVLCRSLFTMKDCVIRLRFEGMRAGQLGLFTNVNVNSMVSKDLADVMIDGAYACFQEGQLFCSRQNCKRTSVAHSSNFHKTYDSPWRVDLVIDMTKSNQEAKQTERGTVTFFAEDNELGAMELPPKPFDLMYCTGNYNSVLRLLQVSVSLASSTFSYTYPAERSVQEDYSARDF